MKNKPKTKSKKNPIKVTKFKWYCGDDRSYGNFELVADTPHGKIHGKGLVGPDGHEDETWTLNKKRLQWGSIEDGDEFLTPDLSLPHDCSGRAVERFEKHEDKYVLDALKEWSDNVDDDGRNLEPDL